MRRRRAREALEWTGLWLMVVVVEMLYLVATRLVWALHRTCKRPRSRATMLPWNKGAKKHGWKPLL